MNDSGFIDNMISVLIGVWITLIGFRVLRIPSSPKVDASKWFLRHGMYFKIVGPLVIAGFGGLALASALGRY